MENQLKEGSILNDMYNSALVSFGNFILKQYGAKRDKHGNNAAVSDADLVNWRYTLDVSKDTVGVPDNLDSED